MNIYKGTYGYIKRKQKAEIIKTTAYFGIVLAVFLAGFLTTKTRLNVMTVVAIVGCLPAGKAAVGMIMILRYKEIAHEEYEKIMPYENNLLIAYDLIFTNYEKTQQVRSLAVYNHCIYAYTGTKDFDTPYYTKHIHENAKYNQITNLQIKTFSDIKSYTKRLSSIADMPSKQQEKDEETLAFLLRLCL